MSFVTVSRVKYPDVLKEKIHDIGLKMVPIAKRQPGFISVRFHQSREINETMMYWEWNSESDHEACMESDEWADIMDESKPLFEQEGVEVLIEVFDRLA